MSVLTDLFVASDEELQSACPLRVPPSAGPPWRPSRPFPEAAARAEFPTLEECDLLKKFPYDSTNNLLPDLLEQLHLLLGGDETKFNATFDRPPLMVPGDNPFGDIFQLPPELVSALAKLPKERSASVAEEWLGDKKAKRTVDALRKLASKANYEGKNMYLLMIA
jgi:hypothetical protein